MRVVFAMAVLLWLAPLGGRAQTTAAPGVDSPAAGDPIAHPPAQDTRDPMARKPPARVADPIAVPPAMVTPGAKERAPQQKAQPPSKNQKPDSSPDSSAPNGPMSK